MQTLVIKLLVNFVVASNYHIALNMFEHVLKLHISHTTRCIIL